MALRHVNHFSAYIEDVCFTFCEVHNLSVPSAVVSEWGGRFSILRCTEMRRVEILVIRSRLRLRARVEGKPRRHKLH